MKAQHVSSGIPLIIRNSKLYLQPLVYIHMWCKYSLELLMMSDMPLETCWAFNKRWNNKFYYKVASCWLFIRIHTTIHGSMNIKFYLLIYVFFILAQQPPVGQGPLIVEDSRSHSDTQQSVGLLWTSDQPDALTSTWQHTTHKRQTSMSLAGLEPTIPASERQQTHALDLAATGTGILRCTCTY